MKRYLVCFSIVALLLGMTAGCSDDDCNFHNPYCDDSGCYNCDCNGCWWVQNDPCETINECATGEVCTPYGCARPCNFDSDCGQGERCLAEGICGPADDVETPCDTDEDCGSGMICEDNVCIAGCLSDEDCPGDQVCASCNRCVDPGSGCGDPTVYCTEDAQCGTGRVCTEFSCAYSCDISDPLCPHGQVCIEGVCVEDPDNANPECLGVNSQCDALEQCADLGCQCLNGYCQSLCESIENCDFGQICDFGGDPFAEIGQCKANYRPGE